MPPHLPFLTPGMEIREIAVALVRLVAEDGAEIEIVAGPPAGNDYAGTIAIAGVEYAFPIWVKAAYLLRALFCLGEAPPTAPVHMSPDATMNEVITEAGRRLRDSVYRPDEIYCRVAPCCGGADIVWLHYDRWNGIGPRRVAISRGGARLRFAADQIANNCLDLQ